ncbi:replication-relaxation family protein (plasmid) [Myxococcus sp. MxC21-1]|uniref:replication-relaxation family protein n=1 Tax=Myxococcus sp. MxC21-1 TaxID=3041439 RepID=UPI002930AC7C|nr:replication-relaxation family protein [Myxococcus sp. MxC21-1]WNZ66238.1 replication-relaxation family protein [Myxococcus sp. MxC21-1]
MSAGEPVIPSSRRGRGRPRLRPHVRARLQERDRYLLAALATLRYLDASQVARLFFPGRNPSRATVRLWELAGDASLPDAPAYVRRLEARYPDGQPRQAWTPTELGYRVAADVLGQVKVPIKDPAPQFFAHALSTAELFVELLASELPVEKGGRGAAAKVAPFARVDDHRFRWIASDSAHKPWKEYSQSRSVWEKREMRPDAILEVPSARRRLFIECEMGSQVVSPVSADAPGATVNKLARYAAFLLDGAAADPDSAGRSFYAQAFSDGFSPELLFLVQSVSRQRTVAAAVDAWRANWRSANPTLPHIAVRVDLTSSAVPYIHSLLGAPVSSSSVSVATSLALDATDVGHLREFYKATRELLQALRADAKARDLPKPASPAGMQEVHAILERLKRPG